MIIAIDGEASTGKSTQAKKIAKRLNINYRDSGAYYRAITLYLIRNQINPKETLGKDLFSKIDISQKFENPLQHRSHTWQKGLFLLFCTRPAYLITKANMYLLFSLLLQPPMMRSIGNLSDNA